MFPRAAGKAYAVSAGSDSSKENAGLNLQANLNRVSIDSGIVLACQTFPEKDVIIDIPRESRLVIGDKIALSKSGDLLDLLHSFEVGISPIVREITLNLPPPTLNDNISDLERLKRSLAEKGLFGMRFIYGFVSSLPDTLRNADWKITFGYTVGNDVVYIVTC